MPPMKAKVFLGALVLLALCGVVAWWKLTEVERNLAALERGEDVQAWLVEHKLDERVFAGVNAQVTRLVEDPARQHPLTEAQRKRLDRYSAFYELRNASDVFTARVAYGRLRYEPALRWGSERDEGYVAIEALRWLADQPEATIEPTMQWLFPEVLRLQRNRRWILETSTLLWARFGNPTAQAFRDTLPPQELTDTASSVLLINNLPPAALKRVFAELLRLKVEPEGSFAVGDDDHVRPRPRARDARQRRHRALEGLREALAAARHEVRISGAQVTEELGVLQLRFRERELGEHSEVTLTQLDPRGDREVQEARRGRGRLHGSAEIARVDRRERRSLMFGSEPCREPLGLRSSICVERDFELTLQSARDVPVGLAVPNDPERRHRLRL